MWWAGESTGHLCIKALVSFCSPILEEELSGAKDVRTEDVSTASTEIRQSHAHAECGVGQQAKPPPETPAFHKGPGPCPCCSVPLLRIQLPANVRQKIAENGPSSRAPVHPQETQMEFLSLPLSPFLSLLFKLVNLKTCLPLIAPAYDKHSYHYA